MNPKLIILGMMFVKEKIDNYWSVDQGHYVNYKPEKLFRAITFFNGALMFKYTVLDGEYDIFDFCGNEREMVYIK